MSCLESSPQIDFLSFFLLAWHCEQHIQRETEHNAFRFWVANVFSVPKEVSTEPIVSPNSKALPPSALWPIFPASDQALRKPLVL